MKGKSKVLTLFVLLFFICGCASIISKSMYPVTISSQPSGASITITDERGLQIYKGKTPTTLTLSAGEAYFHAKQYTIKFSKPGYGEQTTFLKAGMDGWYVGNILIGGLLGFLIVDPLTGAMWKLPNQVILTLAEEISSNKNGHNLSISAIDQIPENLKKQLIRIN